MNMNKTSNKRMESNSLNSYFLNFQIAQLNLNKLIEEERMLRKLNKSKVKN